MNDSTAEASVKDPATFENSKKVPENPASNPGRSDLPDCAICQRSLSDTTPDDIMTLHPCYHAFHTECYVAYVHSIEVPECYLCLAAVDKAAIGNATGNPPPGSRHVAADRRAGGHLKLADWAAHAGGNRISRMDYDPANPVYHRHRGKLLEDRPDRLAEIVEILRAIIKLRDARKH
ncbi:hypothetical protein FPV67DRAFT_1682524 [Lyophyllum atratum]|nr:hypothetical protein FPV67DRAFT_1682524 [Lyophyllum atratum]